MVRLGSTPEVDRRWGDGPIKLAQLKYFVKVVEAGNISTAASSLNMAQPALGMQIKQLEDELGTDLLVRHSRGVKATPAGLLLYQHAERILGAVEQARREVSNLKSQKAIHLRLGMNPSMVEVLGPNLLTQAKSLLPGIQVSLAEERSQVLLNALERRQLDVAIAYNVDARPDLNRLALIEEDLLFLSAAQPARHSEESAIRFSNVLKTDLAIGGERSIVREIMECEARRLALEVHPAFEVHAFKSVNELVRQGVATTVMPYALCMEEIRAGLVHARRISGPQLTRTLYVVHQRPAPPVLDDGRVSDYVLTLVKTYFEAITPFARWLASEPPQDDDAAGPKASKRAPAD